MEEKLFHNQHRKDHAMPKTPAFYLEIKIVNDTALIKVLSQGWFISNCVNLKIKRDLAQTLAAELATKFNSCPDLHELLKNYKLSDKKREKIVQLLFE